MPDHIGQRGMAAGIDLARGGDVRNADIGEFAIGEVRAEVAEAAVAAADEYLQAALRGFRVDRLRRLVAARQRIAKLVE